MPRAEVGTPKYIANAMKSKGLQRLRWYCQVCEKQCRDENGFKCHMQTEAHLRQMLVVGESAGRHISDFSSQFQSEFVKLLSRRFGTKRVKANTVYQEYIQDKHHLHMNATRWVTLTEFVKHLGRTGVARVDETEKGWFLAWIDNSPKALEKAEASAKKEKLQTSDEQRERSLITAQIQKAQEEAGSLNIASTSDASPEEGLKREEGEKVKLSFGKKPSPQAEDGPKSDAGISSNGLDNSTGEGLSAPPPALKFNALKPAGNPLKTNVFKMASAKASSSKGMLKRDVSSMTAVEALMQEDLERKKRRQL
ncbi:hypothetical protein FRC03_006447 [Tulasnella sp. 419]|nr:hypothetical protein FRC03_006447 [Tulasnella sp. 419]